MRTIQEILNGSQGTPTEPESKKPRTFQDLLSTPSVQGGIRAKVSPEYAEDDLQSKIAFAARMGFADTWRGVKQILGTDEEQMSADQRRLNMYLQNEE